MDSTIQAAIQKLETEFFDALSSGPAQLEAFEKTWASFSGSLETTCEALSPDTLEQLATLAATIGAVSSNMVECEQATVALDQELFTDVAEILDQDPTTSIVETASTHLPPYIEPSYRWLLTNLHNPYPSQQVREDIARKSSSPRKLIDSWFIDVRKRIGWNDIRKEHFSSKAEIIDAATRFFLDQGEHLCGSLEGKFAALQTAAESLYLDKLDASTLASHLDRVVKDMTPELKTQLKAQRRVCKTGRSIVKSYPTPTPSPRATPDPLSPTSSLSGLEDSLPMARTNKRRASDAFEEQSPANTKRHRSTLPGDNDNMVAFILPSPAMSEANLDQDSVFRSQSPAPQPSTSTSSSMTSLKRKRRLSMSGDEHVPKRPNTIAAEPRRQVVSDPLPIPFSMFEQWFSNSESLSFSNIPPVLSTDVPDPSTPLDIEIFNFPQPSNPLDGLPPLDVPSAFTQGISIEPTFDCATMDPFTQGLFEDWTNTLTAPPANEQGMFPGTQVDLESFFSNPPTTNWDPSLPFLAVSPSPNTTLQSHLAQTHYTPSQADVSAQLLRESKQRQLAALEAQLNSIRAEIAAIS